MVNIISSALDGCAGKIKIEYKSSCGRKVCEIDRYL